MLDPIICAFRLPNGDKVMVVDIVGFINKIPHSLVEVFRSTLEEVRSADLLLHLVDMANPFFAEQIQVIELVFEEIGVGEVFSVLVPNKIDVVVSVPLPRLKSRSVEGVCSISVWIGAGIDK